MVWCRSYGNLFRQIVTKDTMRHSYSNLIKPENANPHINCDT